MKRLLFCLNKEILEQNGSSQNEGMKLFKNLLPILFFGAFIFASCNEPSLIGSELVEGEQGDVIFTDTFTLEITTEEGDSLIAFSPAIANYANYLFGDFKDPIFGNTTASFFMRPVGPGFFPDFGTAQKFDSVVLVLPYDTTNAYGDFKDPFSLEIYELIEKVSNEEVYYVDTVFMTETTPFLTKTFQPNLTDSVFVQVAENGDDDVVRFAPHLRIPLGQDFADRLFTTDSLIFESDSLFAENFKGFYFKPVSTTGSMLSFNLSISTLAGIDMFYHPTDSSLTRFHLPVDRLIVSNVVHDRSNSDVQVALDSPEARDSLLFLQGLQGLRAKIELPDLSSLGDIIINRAEIEFTIENAPGDEPSIYEPIDQVLLSTYLSSDTTTKILVNDILVAGNNLETIRRWFGGDIQTNTGKQTYTVSIASHLQDVLNGDRENVLYLETFDRAQKISRSVLKNSKAKLNPAKLNLYYTEFTN